MNKTIIYLIFPYDPLQSNSSRHKKCDSGSRFFSLHEKQSPLKANSLSEGFLLCHLFRCYGAARLLSLSSSPQAPHHTLPIVLVHSFHSFTPTKMWHLKSFGGRVKKETWLTQKSCRFFLSPKRLAPPLCID